MKTPVVLIIFNRPNTTKQVFDVIQKVKPPKLFIISDGPRNEKEIEQVTETRKVVENIHWDCKVYKKYSDTNLGCRQSVALGLDWVFSQVEKAIILEDDCVPDLTFFSYCEQLLEKYKKEKQIMMISGNNYMRHNIKASYNFCRHSLIWGWATWKRAWSNYHTASKDGLIMLNDQYQKYQSQMSSVRLNAIKKTLQGKIDTWDYIWQMALLMNNGYCIFPNINLVKNIGFGQHATHTKLFSFHSNIQSYPMSFPLIHPDNILLDTYMDKKIEKTYQKFSMLLDIIICFILGKNR